MLVLGAAIWLMYFIAIYFAVFWLLIFLDHPLMDGKKKPLKQYPKITVSIPAWNEEKSIVDTVKSVLALEYPKHKLEIIVVDDYSTDNTKQVLHDFLETLTPEDQKISLRYIAHEKNMGKGAALNTALAQAKGEYFVVLDADSFVAPSALKKILPHFAHENIAAVLPYMKLRNRGTLSLALQYVEYLVNFFLKKLMGTLDCIHVTPGPFAVYKKSILKKLNGFANPNLTEDLEMALRLQKNDYKIIQLFGAHVTTLGPRSIKGWFLQRNRWYKGTLINMYKYRSMLFRTKYGEFGFFQLPMVLGAALISIFFAVFIIWQHMIRPGLIKLRDLSYINFDVNLMTQLWFERFTLLDLNYMIIFFGILIFCVGLLWILLAHKQGHEQIHKKNVSSIAMYMIIYPFFLSMVWISVVTDLIRKRKHKW